MQCADYDKYDISLFRRLSKGIVCHVIGEIRPRTNILGLPFIPSFLTHPSENHTKKFSEMKKVMPAGQVQKIRKGAKSCTECKCRDSVVVDVASFA